MVLVCSCGDPGKVRSPFGKRLPRAQGGPVLTESRSRTEWVPFGGAKIIQRRSRKKNLTVQCTLFSRYSSLQRRAHGGFLLQTCAPDTLLLQLKYNHICKYSLYFSELISICKYLSRMSVSIFGWSSGVPRWRPILFITLFTDWHFVSAQTQF